MAIGFGTKFAYAVVTSYYAQQTTELHWFFRHAIYSFSLFALIGLIMDSLGAIAKPMLNLTLAAHFNQPYLSTSLREFWGRRWNVVAGTAVRFLVYDPIVEGRLELGG